MAVRKGMFGSRSRGSGRKTGYDAGRNTDSALIDRIENAAAECFGDDAPLERLAELLERIAADRAGGRGAEGEEEYPGYARGRGSEREGGYSRGNGERRETGHGRESGGEREGGYSRGNGERRETGYGGESGESREGGYRRGGYGGGNAYGRAAGYGRYQAARLPQQASVRLPQSMISKLSDPASVDPELGRRIINGIYAEADALSDVLPGFDLGEALSDMTFAETLAETFSVLEAYNAMTRMPRRAPRAAIAQNGQTAVRGTGESSVNPARLESEDFMRYIEKLRNR